MSGLKETKNHIKSTMTLALGVEDGSLIDFETTRRPRIDREHEVITLGYFHGHDLVVSQRKTREKEPFYREIRQILTSIPRPCPRGGSLMRRDGLTPSLSTCCRSSGTHS